MKNFFGRYLQGIFVFFLRNLSEVGGNNLVGHTFSNTCFGICFPGNLRRVLLGGISQQCLQTKSFGN